MIFKCLKKKKTLNTISKSTHSLTEIATIPKENIWIKWLKHSILWEKFNSKMISLIKVQLISKKQLSYQKTKNVCYFLIFMSAFQIYFIKIKNL